MPQPRIRGAKIWMIKRDLADGKTQSSIARTYGCSQALISAFSKEHAAEIAEMRAMIADAMAELWIADKKNRVATYQEIADDLAEVERPADDESDESDERPKRAASAFGKVTKVEAERARMQALRAVADELGDIPQRLKIEGGREPVRHVLEGVDPEHLA